jgi:ABC-2 type transport system ATP-binding protein
MLTAHHLQKRYGTRLAVDGLSVTINAGEVVGLLGPNGAGKSTTIGMLAGLIVPDKGEALLDAVPTSRAKRGIGLVPQDIAIFEELSARQNLRVFGALYGLSGAALHERIDLVLADVGLTNRANDATASFSGGMKRRLNIAAALLHDPDVLLFDEPTVGVDPQSRNAIFDHIERLKARGKAILYSTHYMEEAERLCDRVVIVDHGAVVASDTPTALYGLLPARVMVTVETNVVPTAAVMTGLQRWRVEPASSGGQITLHMRDLASDLPAAVDLLREAGIAIQHLETRQAGLEAVFLQLTGRALRDADEHAQTAKEAA